METSKKRSVTTENSIAPSSCRRALTVAYHLNQIGGDIAAAYRNFLVSGEGARPHENRLPSRRILGRKRIGVQKRGAAHYLQRVIRAIDHARQHFQRLVGCTTGEHALDHD